jgi:hypothetical protein
MIVLRSSGVMARLDPAHGGEILDLIDVETGRQLLGRPPFASLPPVPMGHDEAVWVASYRGGWQLLTPNAGNACSVEGELHPFHGGASNAQWATLEEDVAAATLRWTDRGLQVTRRIVLDGRTLRAETEWLALRARVGLVAVEHIALGLELLAPSATIRLPGGVAFELSEAGDATSGADTDTRWPDVLLLDGSVERGDIFSLADANGRFFAVESVPEGWYEVVNDVTGQALRVEWDVASQAHLWVWREVRVSGGPWRRQGEILALEPASVPHSLGLARALVDGHAVVLEEGQRFRTSISATPFQERKDLA